MKSMMACCGLNCSECPTFLATRDDNDSAREKVAALWKKQFSMKLTAQDINCDGCLSDTGRLFAHCRNCQIKKCCLEKGMVNCASCQEYPCEKLAAFYTFVPQARAGIESLRENRG